MRLYFALFILICLSHFTKAQEGTMIDLRDSAIYKTIKIGGQEWMAQNLDFSDSLQGICYLNVELSCTKFGALYTWTNAQHVCPSGWHLPTRNEFEKLLENVDRDKEKGYSTLAKGGISGFEGLLAGLYYAPDDERGWFRRQDTFTAFWTSTKIEKSWLRGSDFYAFKARNGFKKVWITTESQFSRLSVRCVKD